MELRQLRYFAAVATHENFSKAARQLYIAQPALSRSIRLLEEELGVRLFERHLRGATLTPEGRALLDRADFLLRAADDIRRDLHDAQAAPSGPVIIGMTPNFAAMVGAELAHEVRQTYPRAQLRIVEAYSPDLRDGLRKGSIDLAVLSGSGPHAREDLATESLFEDRLCVVGRAGDPLLGRAELSPAVLGRIPLILTGMSAAGIRNELETLAGRKRIALDVVVEVGSIELASRMIAIGMGYTVYVASGIAGNPGLAAAPIAGLWLRRSLGWSSVRPLSRLGGEVLKLVRTRLLTMVAEGRWPGARLAGRHTRRRRPGNP